jgi:hypothetical protein
MVIRKLSKFAIFELVFGLLPATITVMPFSILMTLLALGAFLLCWTDSNITLFFRVFYFLIPVFFAVLLLCELSGLIALWCAFLLDSSYIEVRPKLKFALSLDL